MILDLRKDVKTTTAIPLANGWRSHKTEPSVGSRKYDTRTPDAHVNYQ